MIKEKQSLSMAEASEILGGIKENDKIKDSKVFIKKFSDIAPKEAKELRQELEKLELLKIKQEDIAKIIDILPEDAAELNKIFTEVTLDAEETNKILQTVKKYR